MNRNEVVKELKKILGETVDRDPDEINETDSLLEDIELSSIEVLTMVSDLEDIYEIKIPTDKLDAIVTVSDLANEIMKQRENN